MVEQRNKLLFIVILAILIVAGSFYNFWQKSSVAEVASSDDVAVKNESRQPEQSDEIFVYISGAVHKPGVFKASPNARVFDIVEMAGGLTAEADVAKTNLAQSIKDGMHIHVVDKLPASNEHSATGTAKTKVGNKVNINHADKSELDTLPGVGPALAERIIEYRQTIGSFNSIDELKNVPGIGSSKFEKLKERIIN
ncbi:helix-hairpin-helix domain-containing protein [Pelosinus propionicus]|uniref:Competence protein ComEA n=1 Tax=Pelosinus propionicus DSM 13327 TaxID=1123291 RepID=A0A1I4GPG2_9FIRM|nr:helix-hairpin-helix domain-containing protein [Pelosinus propionicus]SFL31962.1 competence protein ComEA [Pelosinus propionicus DSM 13327]